MLKLLGLKFDSYKKFNILLTGFTGRHLTQNIPQPGLWRKFTNFCMVFFIWHSAIF